MNAKITKARIAKVQWSATLFADEKSTVDRAAAVEYIKSGFAGLESSKSGLMERFALVAYRDYYVTKTAGTGAGQTGRNAYAAEFGVSTTYVTMARRLGVALFVHGVQPGSELWQGMTKRVNNKIPGTDQTFGAKYLDPDEKGNLPAKADIAEMTKAIAKPAPVKRAAQVPTPAKVTKNPALGLVKDALDTIRKQADNLTPAQVRTLEKDLTALRVAVLAGLELREIAAREAAAAKVATKVAV